MSSTLFSKKTTEKHIVYKILGIKLKIKKHNYVNHKTETKKAIKIQNKYDLKHIKIS